ncbi:MAG: endonuclease/exonuclease/phosphatase family protein, partial [Aeromicrobium sp.]
MPFARRALLALALLTSSTLTLMTPAAQAAPVSAQAGRSSVSVLTFNVCGHAKGCGSFSKREGAVVKRILASKADVVNVQEGWGVLDRIGQRLAPHGYLFVASSGNEGIFAKASKISAVTTSETVTSCRRDRIYAGPETDTTGWEPPSHTDESGVRWRTDENSAWYRKGDVCTDQVVVTPKNGQVSLGPSGRAGATWAMLRVKRTNKTYLFVSAHLTTGKDKVARKRSGETVRLLAAIAKVAEGRPQVFAGDFNSSIQRGKDTVGKRFKARGFADSYTKARKRTATKYNSATGWGKKPRVGGSHIDRVFLPRGATASRWALDVKTRRGKSVKPIPS